MRRLLLRPLPLELKNGANSGQEEDQEVYRERLESTESFVPTWPRHARNMSSPPMIHSTTSAGSASSNSSCSSNSLVPHKPNSDSPDGGFTSSHRKLVHRRNSLIESSNSPETSTTPASHSSRRSLSQKRQNIPQLQLEAITPGSAPNTRESALSFFSKDEPETFEEENDFFLSSSGKLTVPGFTVDENGLTPTEPSPNITRRRQSAPEFLENNKTPGGGVFFEQLVFLKTLGKGASGVVRLALHTTAMRLVAVKSVPVFDNSKRAQLVHELESLYTNTLPLVETANEKDPTGSPYIVGMYNAFVERSSSTIQLVLEYMDGGSIQDRIDSNGPLSQAGIALLLHCALRGLAHIHKQRQIHRDIKPSNMLLSKSRGIVKLSDFGTAISFDTSHSHCNTFVGSVSYMAPERIDQESGGYSYPSDIWSLAITVLTCAMGKDPFQETYHQQGYFGLLSAIVNEPPPALPAGFSPLLADFVSQCLQKDASKRPTARELLEHPFLTRAYPFSSIVGSQLFVSKSSLFAKLFYPSTSNKFHLLDQLLSYVAAARYLYGGEKHISIDSINTLARQLDIRVAEKKVQALLRKRLALIPINSLSHARSLLNNTTIVGL